MLLLYKKQFWWCDVPVLLKPNILLRSKKLYKEAILRSYDVAEDENVNV